MEDELGKNQEAQLQESKQVKGNPDMLAGQDWTGTVVIHAAEHGETRREKRDQS
jgi:hypothetical protein